MEKTYAKRNIFQYIVELFRSVGESTKAVFEPEEEEAKEGLEAFDESRLSEEDAKILATLKASKGKAIASLEKDQAKRIEAIDYPDKGKSFKSGMRAQEQEAEYDEKEREEDSEERELD